MVTVSTLHWRTVRVPAVCREGREREKKRESERKKKVRHKATNVIRIGYAPHVSGAYLIMLSFGF